LGIENRPRGWYNGIMMDKEKDLAYRVLRLEQQLESYQKLHTEELDEIRKALAEIKTEILAIATSADRAMVPGASSAELSAAGVLGSGDALTASNH